VLRGIAESLVDELIALIEVLQAERDNAQAKADFGEQFLFARAGSRLRGLHEQTATRLCSRRPNWRRSLGNMCSGL